MYRDEEAFVRGQKVKLLLTVAILAVVALVKGCGQGG